MADFRDSDSWNEARILVCVLLEMSGHWARRGYCLDLAKSVEHYSVSLLDGLAQGDAQTGNTGELKRAQRSLDELESLLPVIRERGALDMVAVGTLGQRIALVKHSLNIPGM